MDWTGLARVLMVEECCMKDIEPLVLHEDWECAKFVICTDKTLQLRSQYRGYLQKQHIHKES
jgi:hypothetical protein